MGSLDYITIENFLEKEFFDSFKKICFSSDIDWHFNKNMTKDDDYFFSHCFIKDHVIRSTLYIDFIVPILKKLNSSAVSEARANLMLKKEKLYQSTFHSDRPFDCRTAILYLNTCNGYTMLDEEKKIKINCEENKILIFNSKIRHAAFSQTDEERRIVINFNYFENKTN
jgi:hypothetical protein